MTVDRRPFGSLRDGRAVASCTLQHDASGFAIEVLELGATLRAIRVPDAHGRRRNVILGYETPALYEEDRVYLGALIGRCAGRIAHGVAHVGGRRVELARNEGSHHLHGGTQGFHRALWRTVRLSDGELPSLTLAHQSADGEQGYPGRVRVNATFRLTSALSFAISLEAVAEQATPLNLTLHPYFNLGGTQVQSPMEDHALRIDADTVLAVSADGIPNGERLRVAGTPFDFRQPASLAQRLAQAHPQLRARGGFDHYYVLNGAAAAAVELSSRASGIRLALSTNQPGVHLYSGNALGAGTSARFRDREGLCIEPQGFPDAADERRPGHVIRLAGDVYRHVTQFAFSAQPVEVP